MKKFSIIVAIDNKRGIGREWKLCWHFSEDMKYFKNITSNVFNKSKRNALIMGRKTYESIPSKYKPLPKRLNCILSRKTKTNSIIKDKEDISYFNSFDICLESLNNTNNIENIFLIGWWQLYNQFINHPQLDKIYITSIPGDYSCDAFFPEIGNNFKLSKTKKGKIVKSFNIYNKVK